MAKITGFQLWSAMLKDKRLCSDAELAASASESPTKMRALQRHCHTVARELDSMLEAPVTVKNLAKLDRFWAEMIRRRLEDERTRCRRDLMLRSLVDKALERNAEFDELVRKLALDAEDLTDEGERKWARYIMRRRLGMPKSIVDKCLSENWTMGRLMLAYPRLVMRSVLLDD